MKKGDRFLLIRINSSKALQKKNCSILDEQYELYLKNGYVWFLKTLNYLKILILI